MSLYVFLEGWHRDITVPLAFSNDSLQALMQSKSTVDNGWWWFNPMLGAPFGLNELAFPTNSNVDQAIVWIVSRFVRDAITSTNLAWVVIVILSGLSASWCMRRLGVSTISASVAGTLFALSPYALYRQIDHFWLVIYLVPFAATVALLLTTGADRDGGRRMTIGAPLAAGCALIGFDYIYYAFFSCFFIGFAAAIGLVTYRDRRILLSGVLCLALVGGATILNLGPSLYSWSVNSKPIVLAQKLPAESEVYGLKVRQLVSPAFQHPFWPFRRWTEMEAAARFPLENENAISRLGVVGSVGFLGLIALLFAPGAAGQSDRKATLIGASQLCVAAVLLSTVGGFGSLFSLLVSPEIRGYNRVVPFIAFFSLIAVALAIDGLAKTRNKRLAAAAGALVIGLADQRAAAIGLNAVHPKIAAETLPLKTFVSRLEGRLPVGAMVLQLPFRPYPNDSGVARFRQYEHFKPYLVSHSLRWSYPALTNQQLRWQQTAATLPTQRLLTELAAEGFAAVLIDRYGYDDNGGSITAAARLAIGHDAVIAETDRYVALDITTLATGTARRSMLHDAPAVTLGKQACGEQTPLLAIDRLGVEGATGANGPVHLRASDELRMTGWAVDEVAGETASGVDVLVDQTLFPALYGFDRSDVADYFKQPRYRTSGFLASIAANQLRKGPQTVSLRVASSDGRCFYERTVGSIIVD